MLSHLVCGTAHLVADPGSVWLLELTGELIEMDAPGVLLAWSAVPDTAVRK